MNIVWWNKPATIPDVPDGAHLVTATGAPGKGPDLRARFLDAARNLGAALIAEGTAPSQIRALEVHAPSPDAIMSDLTEIDLLYREALSGTFGQVAMMQADELFLKAYAVVPAPDDKPVYRNYSVAALNAQYSPRSSVPETPEILARWRLDGTAYQPSRSAEMAYGDGEKNRIDVFMPDGVSRPPLHVFIHGGYWQALDKRDNCQFSKASNDAGVAVTCVNYSLCPPATIKQIIKECRQSIRILSKMNPNMVTMPHG